MYLPRVELIALIDWLQIQQTHANSQHVFTREAARGQFPIADTEESKWQMRDSDQWSSTHKPQLASERQAYAFVGA